MSTPQCKPLCLWWTFAMFPDLGFSPCSAWDLPCTSFLDHMHKTFATVDTSRGAAGCRVCSSFGSLRRDKSQAAVPMTAPAAPPLCGSSVLRSSCPGFWRAAIEPRRLCFPGCREVGHPPSACLPHPFLSFWAAPFLCSLLPPPLIVLLL